MAVSNWYQATLPRTPVGMNQKENFRAADRDFEATVLGVSDDGLLGWKWMEKKDSL